MPPQATPLPAPTPVVVIGGFLGAGKTSVLNHVLGQCRDLRVAVLVNDFGALNIDAELVIGIQDDVIRLSNGCICCNIRGDLIGGCFEVLRRPERPDLLIIETSGVSNALQVAETLLAPELRQLLSVQALLAVVDAAHFAGLDDDMAALAQAQLAGADIVILNKVDLASADALVELKARIGAAVPGARILKTSHGKVPLQVVLDQIDACSAVPPTLRPIGLGMRGHAGLTSWHWESGKPISLERLRGVFSGLPDGVYRAKGIVHLDDLPGYRVLLQMVGRRSSLAVAGAWDGQRPATRIVLIGKQESVDAAEMRSVFDACVADAGTAASPLKAFAAALARTAD